MRFGMLHLFESPAERSEHQIIHEQLELMRAAEDLGFDSVWPAEHHFTEYGYCASPAISLAAIAAETRLGGLDRRKVLHSMELMQDKVIPKLRQSTPPPLV